MSRRRLRDLPRENMTVIFSLAAGIILMAFAVAEASDEAINAFLLKNIPVAYAERDRFLNSLHDTGANTIIVELPLLPDGKPDVFAIRNLVYLSHRAGLRILVILPVRKMSAVLIEHPDWEDLEYDPETSSLRKTGKIDLFVDDAVKHLASLAADVASNAVDGIVFGDDFMYGSYEGLSRQALRIAENKLGTSVKTRKLFKRKSTPEAGGTLDQFGPLFPSWVSVKRDRLLEVFDTIRRAAQAAAKRPLVTGVSVPVMLPVADTGELLARYSLDMNGLRKLNVDLYWTVIEVQNFRDAGSTTYRQSLELLSRAVLSAVTFTREENKTVLIIPAAAANGRSVSLTELEESTSLLKHSSGVGLGFLITPSTKPSSVFLQKVFRRSSR